MSNSRDKAGLPRDLLVVIMKKNKNKILNVLQEKKVDLGVLGLTTKNGDTLAHLIFQNKFCTEEDIIELLETLFDQGIDPNIGNSRRETVLHLAVANKMRGVVDYLMKRKVDIYKTDQRGSSITHFFIIHEGTKFSKLINDKKINRIQLEEIESESTNFVEWLIGKGFDFDCRSYFRKSALHLSIEYNLHHIVIVLLKHTKDVSYITRCNENLLYLFLRGSADYRRKFGFASRNAADIVKFLLDKGVSAVAVAINQSPLSMAFVTGEEQSIIDMMINHLLKTYSQYNLATNVLVELCKSCGCWDNSKAEYYLTILRNLVAEDANVNSRDKYGTTPLHWAFRAKNLRVVEFLNDHGADFGQGLFHELACKTHYDKSTNEETEALFELLVSKGCCDMHSGDEKQDTPLHISCDSNSKENLVIARNLIEHGADVNSKNIVGETPLDYAVMDNGVAMAELLLERGADVNSKDKSGNRPICHAVFSGLELLVPLLLKWRACVNVKTNNTFYNSIFSEAVNRNHLSIAKEMLAYGADISPQNILYRFIEYPIVRNDSLHELIMQHWIKLDAAKLPCSIEYEKASRCFDYNEQLRNDCCTEIKLLKSTFIDKDRRTSIYTFLHMDFGSRRMHINNEKLKNLVDSPDLEKQFPQYFVLILASYRETVTWKSLLQPAKQAWIELTGVPWPNICSELIFEYLKNEDLLSIVECVEDEIPQ